MAELTPFVGTGGILIIALLGVVLLTRYGMPIFRKRYQARGELRQLDVLALTPQCSVALVQTNQDMLVLGLTAQTVTLLNRTPRSTIVSLPSHETSAPQESGRRLRLVQGKLGQDSSRIPPVPA